MRRLPAIMGLLVLCGVVAACGDNAGGPPSATDAAPFYDARRLVAGAVADTLLDRVRAEVWEWKDGDQGSGGELYGRWMALRGTEADLFDVYRIQVGLSRPAVGGPEFANPEGEAADPIRVTIRIFWAQEEEPIAVREGKVTEAEARAMEHAPLIQAFKDRHASIRNEVALLGAL